MNKKIIPLGAVLVAVSFLLGSTDAQSQRRPTYQLDVKKPIEAIVPKLLSFLNKITFETLKELVLAALPCLEGLIGGSAGIFHHPLSIGNLTNRFDTIYQKEYAEKLASLPLESIFQNLNFEGYCSTDDFKAIHNFVWKEDDQFSDLLSFMHRFNYPEVYGIIKALYTANGCPQELIDELPTGPTQKTEAKSNSNGKLPDVRGQILREMHLSKQEDPKPACNITKIIGIVLDPNSGVLDLVQLLGSVIQEFNTNPSAHFLLGKIQEPIKGQSVRKFTRLEAVENLINNIDAQMKQNEHWMALLQFLKALTGIDVTRINIVDLVVSILIMVIWPLGI